jgi:hypothetical protein
VSEGGGVVCLPDYGLCTSAVCNFDVFSFCSSYTHLFTDRSDHQKDLCVKNVYIHWERFAIETTCERFGALIPLCNWGLLGWRERKKSHCQNDTIAFPLCVAQNNTPLYFVSQLFFILPRPSSIFRNYVQQVKNPT